MTTLNRPLLQWRHHGRPPSKFKTDQYSQPAKKKPQIKKKNKGRNWYDQEKAQGQVRKQCRQFTNPYIKIISVIEIQKYSFLRFYQFQILFYELQIEYWTLDIVHRQEKPSDWSKPIPSFSNLALCCHLSESINIVASYLTTNKKFD